jgi:hypothetical protein
MSWAKVGNRCVCIDAVSGVGRWVDDAPEEGRVYTISRVWVTVRGRTNIEFHELKRSDFSRTYFGFDVGYAIARFRPLVTKTQSEDVAMFKRIADQVPNMEENTNEQV